MTVFQLIPGVQSYDWGVPGGEKNSICADLAEATCQLQFERKADKPYAEVRRSTHAAVDGHAPDAAIARGVQ